MRRGGQPGLCRGEQPRLRGGGHSGPRAPHRVRVNTLVPGFVPAEQNKKVLTPERVASIMGHTPMGRFGQANELVGAALLLASEAAGSFITGTEIVVDGGFNAMSL